MLIYYMSGDKSKNVTEINAIQSARDVSKAAAGMVRGVSPEHSSSEDYLIYGDTGPNSSKPARRPACRTPP
jgi:hypothetical protein